MKHITNTVLSNWLWNELQQCTSSTNDTLQIMEGIEQVLNNYGVSMLDDLMLATLTSTYSLGEEVGDCFRMQIPDELVGTGLNHNGEVYAELRQLRGLEKITLIKSIRSISNFGLKEAKDLADLLCNTGFATIPITVDVYADPSRIQSQLDAIKGFRMRYSNYIVEKPEITG